MTARPAVILLSGGLDSAVSLGVARRDGFACHTLSVDYGQRHRVELAAAAKIAHACGVASHRTIALDLRAVGGSALTGDIAVPKDRAHAPGAHHHEASDIPITYVPARNMTMLSLAAGLAEVLGADDLFIGVNAIDYSGYPDCRPAFIRAFEHAANLGTKRGVEGGQFRVHTPLIERTKADIIRLGVELGVDLSLTTSCYDPSPRGPCGHCDSCLIRARGFADAGLPDPALASFHL
ncbi:MAG: 7-cyano-7-deazaguanine synthase QueC [Planctomycetota bacterium]|nr:7-cyano-7-deazaguanine synthase QueC [Planctomycetota bacterium]